MPNAKRFEFPLGTTGLTTIVVVLVQRATGYICDNADGAFRASPAQKTIPAAGDASLPGGIYYISESRQAFQNGSYAAFFYNTNGEADEANWTLLGKEERDVAGDLCVASAFGGDVRRFEYPVAERSLSTIVVVLVQRATGYICDNADGVFRPSPAQKTIPAAEDTSVPGGIYYLVESRQAFVNGSYIAYFFNTNGEADEANWSLLGKVEREILGDVTALDICNEAILSLGGNEITSFADGSAEARLCTAFWTTALDLLLRLHPWNCCVKRATLVADVDAPLYGWSYSYPLPPDYLRMLDPQDCPPYKIESGKILCNESSLNIRYVWRNTSPATWDRLLVSAMTAYMTYRLAYPITKSNTNKQDAWSVFADILKTAKAVDAQEEPQDDLGDFPFLAVRR